MKHYNVYGLRLNLFPYWTLSIGLSEEEVKRITSRSPDDFGRYPLQVEDFQDRNDAMAFLARIDLELGYYRDVEIPVSDIKAAY